MEKYNAEMISSCPFTQLFHTKTNQVVPTCTCTCILSIYFRSNIIGFDRWLNRQFTCTCILTCTDELIMMDCFVFNENVGLYIKVIGT